MGEATKGDQPLARREFLAAAGVAGLSLALSGCGEVAAGTAKRTAGLRNAAILPARSAPISGLQRVMRGHVFARGAPGFTAVSHVYNERFDSVSPLAVARPNGAADVRRRSAGPSATAFPCAPAQAATATPDTRPSPTGSCSTSAR